MTGLPFDIPDPESSESSESSECLQPMFLEPSLFERKSKEDWTTFEVQLWKLLIDSPAAMGLNFSQKLAIAECMRHAGRMMVERMESKEHGV